MTPSAKSRYDNHKPVVNKKRSATIVGNMALAQDLGLVPQQKFFLQCPNFQAPRGGETVLAGCQTENVIDISCTL